MLNVIMLGVIMLSNIILIGIMLSVVMLGVVAPEGESHHLPTCSVDVWTGVNALRLSATSFRFNHNKLVRLTLKSILTLV